MAVRKLYVRFYAHNETGDGVNGTRIRTMEMEKEEEKKRKESI